MYFFFFFQAEDGIRDGHVTGVQTCALPISTPGSFVLLPRGIPHAFTVAATGPCRVLTINTPAGFERFVAEAGRPAGQLTLPDPQPPDVPLLLALAPKYGHEYVAGPAAGQADGQPGATTQTATAPSAPAGPAG